MFLHCHTCHPNNFFSTAGRSRSVIHCCCVGCCTDKFRFWDACRTPACLHYCTAQENFHFIFFFSPHFEIYKDFFAPIIAVDLFFQKRKSKGRFIKSRSSSVPSTRKFYKKWRLLLFCNWNASPSNKRDNSPPSEAHTFLVLAENQTTRSATVSKLPVLDCLHLRRSFTNLRQACLHLKGNIFPFQFSPLFSM